MAPDAYRGHEEATRARLVALEIELENSQKRIVAIRLDIASTELRYPPNSTSTRQAVAILLLGADVYIFMKIRPLSFEAAVFLFFGGVALLLLALPLDFAKAIQRRADRGKLEEAERARAAIARRISEAKATLGPAPAEPASDAPKRDVRW